MSNATLGTMGGTGAIDPLTGRIDLGTGSNSYAPGYGPRVNPMPFRGMPARNPQDRMPVSKPGVFGPQLAELIGRLPPTNPEQANVMLTGSEQLNNSGRAVANPPTPGGVDMAGLKPSDIMGALGQPGRGTSPQQWRNFVGSLDQPAPPAQQPQFNPFMGGLGGLFNQMGGYGMGYNPYMGGGFGGFGGGFGGGFNPYMGGGFNPYMGGGFNPYMGGGFGGGQQGFGGGFNPYMGGNSFGGFGGGQGFGSFGGGFNPYMGSGQGFGGGQGFGASFGGGQGFGGYNSQGGASPFGGGFGGGFGSRGFMNQMGGGFGGGFDPSMI